MDTVLLSSTLIALGLAGAMGVLVAKMLRDERKRSDARVATLIELAAESGATRPIVVPPGAGARVAARPRPAPAAGARVGQDLRLDEFEIRPASTVASADIFAEPERSSPWGRRLAVIGVIVALGGTVLFVSTVRSPGSGVNTPADAEQRAVGAPAAPIELVSMRHTQDGDTLTITGLVQNPKAGAALTRIAVTAVVFGADGTFLASGRAPLDYTSLAAGDESPFVVTVPVRSAVARYRVGFRSEDGGVVAHIDRRAGDVSRAGM
jgi:hypothetical protein